MTVTDILCLAYCILFTGMNTRMMIGIFQEWLRDRHYGNPDSACVPPVQVSVIIPVKNESRRMRGLLRSLLAQDYPAEIIFVNDCSDDESPAMLAEFVRDAAQKGMDNCTVITLTENPGPNRKQHALSVGIARARGDYLLFTDGDCEAPPGWIRAMVSRMDDESVGAVIGPVFKKKPGRGFFFLYQCYDHAVRYNYLAGTIGMGAAAGGFGNNLLVRRAALDAIGGYGAVPPSSTEDAALISLIRSRRRYRLRAIALPDAAIETEAEQNRRGFIGQTLRWNNGGLFSPEPMTRFNYNLLMLLTCMGIAALPFLPFFPGLWLLPASVLIVMIENTIATFGLFRTMLPPGGPLNLGYLAAMLFTPVYFSLMTVMGYCRVKTQWKGKAAS